MINEIKIPNKSLFKLDEVCSLSGVKPYVLRFWESEFQQISPVVSSTGQKLFEHSDIEAILHVKDLLFDKKMTIENAKFELDKIYSEEEELIVSENECLDDDSKKSLLSMELSTRDLSKLYDAKILLNNMLDLTKSIQTTNNWI